MPLSSLDLTFKDSSFTGLGTVPVHWHGTNEGSQVAFTPARLLSTPSHPDIISDFSVQNLSLSSPSSVAAIISHKMKRGQNGQNETPTVCDLGVPDVCEGLDVYRACGRAIITRVKQSHLLMQKVLGESHRRNRPKPSPITSESQKYEAHLETPMGKMPDQSATAIKACRVCQSPGLDNVLFLGDQYVSDFVASDGNSPRAPLELVRCISCGLVQLRHTFSRKRLYRHYWYRSGISPKMRKALADLVSRTCEISRPSANDLVVDIGCNDGTLLRSYEISGLFLVGFEPAQNLVEEARQGTNWVFNDFFGAGAFRQKFGERRARIVTSIAMFYDLEDPNTFVAGIAEILALSGVWVVQQNYLVAMLEQNGFDNIGHEHLEYYSLGTLQKLLERHGLEVFEVETNDVNGGSFRTFICHKGRYPIGNGVIQMEKYEARLALGEHGTYQRFAANISKIRSQVREFIVGEVGHGKTVYVYGASNRGNTILQYCGLDRTLIKKATDSNPEKWGRRTVGTLIPIVPKEEARRDKPDYFLILPHHFLDEICGEEEEYLETGGKFIVPLPKFRIVTANERGPGHPSS